MFLILGCTGSGKTLLLKRLQTYYHQHPHSGGGSGAKAGSHGGKGGGGGGGGAFCRASLTSLAAAANNAVNPSSAGAAAATSPSSPTSFGSSGGGGGGSGGGSGGGGGAFASLPEAPSTLPTVGTNLVGVRLSRKVESTLREVGGGMAPIWKNYLKDAKSLIYVVDLSARALVSASCIQILELLSSPDLAQKPVLILLNKIDAPSRMKRNFFASLVRLDDAMHHAEQPITVLEISALTGQGLGAVHQWLIDNHSH